MLKIFPIISLSFFLLSGCDNGVKSASQGVKQNSFPIIIDTLSKITPTLSKDKNNDILTEICSVTYGSKNQHNLDDWIERNFSNAANIAQDSENYAILTGKDKSVQRTACASYLSSTINSIPNIENYLVKNNQEKQVSVDERSIIRLMPLKIAVARANADVFSTIATQLELQKTATLEEKESYVKELFKKETDRYLALIKKYTDEENKNVFQLILLEKGHFIFQDSSGFLFDIDRNGVNLYWYNTPWFSKGKILGKEYFTSVK